MIASTLNQDDILSLLKILLVEKNYLNKKEADSGTWPTSAQAAWESYAYHVLGQSTHFMVPNSEQELIRLGIPYEPKQPTNLTEKKATSSEPTSSLGLKREASDVKTLSRVINHAAI